MKKLILVILPVIFCFTSIYAEEKAFNLENLEAPSTPSAYILGLNIGDIDTPKTIDDLEASILANYFDEEKFVIPNEYAIEINPYRVSGQPNFDYKAYIDDTVINNLWQNFSVSIASTTEYPIGDSTFCKALGIGFRSTLLRGKLDDKDKVDLEMLFDANRKLLTFNSFLMNSYNIYLKSINNPLQKDTYQDKTSHKAIILKDITYTTASKYEATTDVFILKDTTFTIANHKAITLKDTTLKIVTKNKVSPKVIILKDTTLTIATEIDSTQKYIDFINGYRTDIVAKSGSFFEVNNFSASMKAECLKKLDDIINQIIQSKNYKNIKGKIADNFCKGIDKSTLIPLQKRLDKDKLTRYGWKWDLDFASAYVFPSNSFDESITPKFGFWTNLTWSHKKYKDLNLTLLGRYIFNNEDFYHDYSDLDDDKIYDSITEFGGQIAYSEKKLSFEIEYINRFCESDFSFSDEKYTFSMNYNFRDNIVLTCNFGKDFDDPNSSEGNFISGFSINYGIGVVNSEDLNQEPNKK
ncbi:MAG: hypothetical protein K9M99_03165 [Candidatus Cloacimonetes bacterium]|nr:hypothetical protein [Candidatus Cloacimonadota bacterium]